MNRVIKVGVLQGGPSTEHDVSLASGKAIVDTIENRLSERYEAVPVFIDKGGQWNINGSRVSPSNWHHYFDVVWNALHGHYGEDGKLQTILDTHGIPYTGSRALSSSIGMNKLLTKQILLKNNINTPVWRELKSDFVRANPVDAAEYIHNTFMFPAVVKPVRGGSSVGVHIVANKQELADALSKSSIEDGSIIIEEFISGDEASCGVIEDFRGQTLYALPPVEIKPMKKFFDYNAKYMGESLEYVPARFPLELNRKIEDVAREVHRILGLRHYSRTDFIMHPRRGIYVLETNTLPGMTAESLFPKSLRAVGSDLYDFIPHVISLTLGL